MYILQMHYDVTLDFNGTNTISITSGARTASTSITQQCNGHKKNDKRTNTYLQHTTQKTKA
jgi:hypothetical protein